MGNLGNYGFFEPEDWDVASRKVRDESKKHSLVREMRSLVRLARKSGQGARGVSATHSVRGAAQRVTVKVRYHDVSKAGSAELHIAHLGYLERAGTGKQGERGELYGPTSVLNRVAQIESPLAGEEHIFRLVVSPENASALNLRSYTREYMKRLQSHLGRRLIWAAVNHYDTEHPHAHVVLRGVDKRGDKVQLSRDFVTREARQVASELATELLGPRPERERSQGYEFEARLERYTELDRILERRADKNGIIAEPSGGRDPLEERGLRKRLDWLRQTGRAEKCVNPETGKACWKVKPKLGRALRQLERRNSSVAVLQTVCAVAPERRRVIDAEESRTEVREELEQGVQGLVRWKGRDDTGRTCVVVETGGGSAYHLPISKRVTEELKKGMVVDIKRAVDKDERIEELATKHQRLVDCSEFSDKAKAAYRRRLQQLEKMSLATAAGKDRWNVVAQFQDKAQQSGPQSYWQMLSVRGNPQPLACQPRFVGPVWLDTVPVASLGSTGAGRELREKLKEREAFLKTLGLSLSTASLKWKLRDQQTTQLAQRLADKLGRTLVAPKQLKGGSVQIHKEPNGETFAEISKGSRIAVLPANRHIQSFDGKQVSVTVDGSGKVQLRQSTRNKGLER